VGLQFRLAHNFPCFSPVCKVNWLVIWRLLVKGGPTQKSESQLAPGLTTMRGYTQAGLIFIADVKLHKFN
jgi:hypothetical protein